MTDKKERTAHTALSAQRATEEMGAEQLPTVQGDRIGDALIAGSNGEEAKA